MLGLSIAVFTLTLAIYIGAFLISGSLDKIARTLEEKNNG